MSDEREPTLAEALAFASDPNAVVPAWGRVLAREVARLQRNASAAQKVIAEFLDAIETLRPQMPPVDYEEMVNVFREIERAVTGGGK